MDEERTSMKGTSTNVDIGAYGICHDFEGLPSSECRNIPSAGSGTFEGMIGLVHKARALAR